VTELLTADNGKPGQIDNQMTVVYGEDIIPSYMMIKRWVAEEALKISYISPLICEENCCALVLLKIFYYKIVV